MSLTVSLSETGNKAAVKPWRLFCPSGFIPHQAKVAESLHYPSDECKASWQQESFSKVYSIFGKEGIVTFGDTVCNAVTNGGIVSLSSTPSHLCITCLSQTNIFHLLSHRRVVFVWCCCDHYRLQMQMTAAVSLRINLPLSSEKIVTHFHLLHSCSESSREETAAWKGRVLLPLCLSVWTCVSRLPGLTLFIIDDQWALRPGGCWAPPVPLFYPWSGNTYTFSDSYTHSNGVATSWTSLFAAPCCADLGRCMFVYITQNDAVICNMLFHFFCFWSLSTMSPLTLFIQCCLCGFAVLLCHPVRIWIRRHLKSI